MVKCECCGVWFDSNDIEGTTIIASGEVKTVSGLVWGEEKINLCQSCLRPALFGVSLSKKEFKVL